MGAESTRLWSPPKPPTVCPQFCPSPTVFLPVLTVALYFDNNFVSAAELKLSCSAWMVWGARHALAGMKLLSQILRNPNTLSYLPTPTDFCRLRQHGKGTMRVRLKIWLNGICLASFLFRACFPNMHIQAVCINLPHVNQPNGPQMQPFWERGGG